MVASVIGQRIANDTNQIVCATSKYKVDKQGRTIAYNLRAIINNLRSVIGTTSGVTTTFTWKSTNVELHSGSPTGFDVKIRGNIVFKTPVGIHNLKLREFDGIVNNDWDVANHINAVVSTYANGYLPNSENYFPNYDANNWTWLLINLEVDFIFEDEV